MDVDGRAVSHVMRAKARPLLRAAGYDQFTDRKAWRVGDVVTAHVSFASMTSETAFGVGCTTYSFSLDGGVLYRSLAPDLVRPQEYQLTFRITAGKGIRQPFFHPWERPKASDRPDIWFVLPDGSNLEQVVEDACDVLAAHMIPLIDRLSSPRAALDHLLTEAPSNPDYATAGVWSPGVAGSPYWRAVALALVRILDVDPAVIEASPLLRGNTDPV